MTRVYWYLWQFAPSYRIREWAWHRWLGRQFHKPKRPTTYHPDRETGVEDPRLDWWTKA